MSGASPSWDRDLPAWVQWVAQDEDGAWWGYEAEPLRHDHGWYENEVGRRVKLEQGPPESGWMDSLRRRLPSAAGH